ncbi:YciI family protein [Streptomyces orinoci]|uniref:YciI family protein n=1 Tax=Streptomyces orinoci TaxID=67339 RepID=A0ABV3JZU9_STRON|nr:YciI family protein [Streptomyces orinoci]
MFFVLLTYQVPLDHIDALLEAHYAHVDRHFAKGTFILAARRRPRTGGAFVARGVGREELEAILAEDPFISSGAASYELFELQPTRSALTEIPAG